MIGVSPESSSLALYSSKATIPSGFELSPLDINFINNNNNIIN